jgi:hypothetical protein
MLPESRHDWLRGCWMLWWSPPAWQWNDLAAVLFARAVERELRRGVFDRFIGQGERKKLNNLAGQQRTDMSRKFWKAILGGGRVTLGEMLQELMLARTSKDPLSNELDAWIRKVLPGLALNFSKDEAARIKPTRDASAHASVDRPSGQAVEEMCDACRRLLSLVYASGDSGPAGSRTS